MMSAAISVSIQWSQLLLARRSSGSVILEDNVYKLGKNDIEKLERKNERNAKKVSILQTKENIKMSSVSFYVVWFSYL